METMREESSPNTHMSARILFVDDDSNILEAHRRNFRRRFDVAAVTTGEEGLALLGSGDPFAVVVADMRMPIMNGIQFLRKAQEIAPDTVRIMLTGNADQQTAMDAVNRGHVFQFLCKPCPAEMLGLALENAVQQHFLITAERELLHKTLAGSIRIMTEILSLQDPESFGLGTALRDRVRAYAEARSIRDSWELEMGAMLSQIGFVTVPGTIVHRLRSGQPLSAADRAVIERVPEVGAGLLAQIPRLETVSRIVLYQQKNFDGSGFPADSVANEDIPVGARLLRILRDVHELEMEGVPKDEVLHRLKLRTGCYDPKVLESVLVSLDIYFPITDARDIPPTAVMLRHLLVGHVLAADVETSDGLLVVKSGTKVTPLLMEKLRNFAASAGLREPLCIQG
jgi:response regulator RpfG family c-di-GMP phosphodiesterase